MYQDDFLYDIPLSHDSEVGYFCRDNNAPDTRTDFERKFLPYRTLTNFYNGESKGWFVPSFMRTTLALQKWGKLITITL